MGKLVCNSKPLLLAKGLWVVFWSHVCSYILMVKQAALLILLSFLTTGQGKWTDSVLHSRMD